MCNQSTQELHMDLKMTSSWKSTPTLLIAVRAGSQAASRSCTNSWMLLEITLQKREKKEKKKKDQAWVLESHWVRECQKWSVWLWEEENPPLADSSTMMWMHTATTCTEEELGNSAGSCTMGSSGERMFLQLTFLCFNTNKGLGIKGGRWRGEIPKHRAQTGIQLQI